MSIQMPANPANPHTIFNTAVMGYLAKDVAGAADVTISELEAQYAVQKLTGTLTGNINVIVPAESKIYKVHNATSGAFAVTVKTAAGTGAMVTQGKRAELWCDGSDVVKAWEQA